MAGGWIKLHRKVMISPIWDNPELLKLWSLCLFLANHKDCRVRVDHELSEIRVVRGQFVTGRDSLHAAYYTKKKPEDKTPRTLWRWMKVLETDEYLSIETSNRYSVVTIRNYSVYQDGDSEDVQENVQPVSNLCPTCVHS